MLELKVFQNTAAGSIANRYAFFASHPDRPRKGKKPRPYFQALSALTGAGKTPMLAQAVSLMRLHLDGEPIVFWMSKAKSVVAQTYANFSAGGKYSELLEGFRVINLGQITPTLIEDGSTPLILMATTGLFNNKDQSDGTLQIYKSGNDVFGEASPWQRLVERNSGGKRRPLIIVYDEGHNLSVQQTDILAELEPEAYLLASATLSLPANFSDSVQAQIRLWVTESGDEDAAAFASLGAVDAQGRPDPNRFMTTAVNSGEVVDAGLVKKTIIFDGTTAPMERCVDQLLDRLTGLEDEIDSQGLGFKPKAIYVCRTNIPDVADKDDHTKPWNQRQAPPARIWRHLVSRGVPPSSIAIYANLNFIEGNQPDEVLVFSRKDSDFDEFTAGNFQHIIFNHALAEGWDDPACYAAYIDKSMGSAVQVEQVIGRTLRQYGAQHYDSQALNSAHFFVRVDDQSVFATAIEAVKAKLQQDGSPIEVVSSFGKSGASTLDSAPKDDVEAPLCVIHADAGEGVERIAELVSQFTTYAADSPDVVGVAHAASSEVSVKNPKAGGKGPLEWTAGGHTNPVRLRWLVNTALRSRSLRALAVSDLKASKFDVQVQVQSNADKAAGKLAADIVEAYFQHAELVYESDTPFVFGTLRVPPDAPEFDNGLHERYAGFRKFELEFARGIDKTGNLWHRNPVSGGFHIPLLSEGDTKSFYPDFLVWKGGFVFCLDTKGSHLLTDAVARKLFDIQDAGKTKVYVRFITEGKQTELRGKTTKGGYTVWKMKAGTPVAIHVDSLDKAMKECLK
jgi:type III restriction enzyme